MSQRQGCQYTTLSAKHAALAPTRSWWLDRTTRDEFQRAAAREHVRQRLQRPTLNIRVVGTCYGRA